MSKFVYSRIVTLLLLAIPGFFVWAQQSASNFTAQEFARDSYVISYNTDMVNEIKPQELNS